jgi:hypothetical protein
MCGWCPDWMLVGDPVGVKGGSVPPGEAAERLRAATGERRPARTSPSRSTSPTSWCRSAGGVLGAAELTDVHVSDGPHQP